MSLRALAARPWVALSVLLLGVYAYFFQAGGWNQNSRFDLVRAIVEDGSLRIDRLEKNTGDDSIRDGHWYCDKAPGASWLCVPTYAVAFTLAGAPEEVPPATLALGAWASIVVAVGLPSAIAAAFLARVARRLGAGRRGALAVALAWGLASMALPYSTLLYGNQLAADVAIIAFSLLLDVRHGAPPTPRRMLAVGALLGFAGATEYPAAMIVLGVALYGLRVAGLRASLWAALGGAAPLLALLGYHAAAFGSPFAFPYDYSVWQTPKTGWFMGIREPHWPALRGILLGEYRGLLWSAPWLALALPGAVLLARRHRAEVAVCGWAVVSFLWLNSSIPPWDGGWAAGPRYLVPMLPFAAALAAGCLPPLGAQLRAGRPGARAVGWLLAAVMVASVAVGAANMFAATAVKPEISTQHRRPFTEFVWPSFLAGRLAVSTQSLDMIDNPKDGPRQAWNLGMKAGLAGHASLVPLYAWIGACAAWLAWAARPRLERGAASSPPPA